MKEFLRVLRPLIALVDLPRWAVASVIGLGFLSACSEALSISLIIPLIQHVANSNITGAGAWLFAPFQRIPNEWRTLAICGSIFGFIILKNALTYVNACLFSWANGSVSHQLRSGILRQLLTVSQSWLDQQDMGRLMNTLGNDTWRASSAFGILAGMVINACMIVIFTALLLVMSWKLTLVTGIGVLITAGVIRYLTKHARRLGGEALRANQAASQRMTEVFSGMRLIRAYSREAYEQSRYDDASQNIRRTFFKMDRMSALAGPIAEILATALLIAILLYSVRNPATLATSVAFLLLLYRLQPRVRQLEADRVTLRTLTASIEELTAVISPDNKTYLTGGRKRLDDLGSSIDFLDTTLLYGSTGAAALTEVNCSIPMRQTTALVGPSGAGKSSVISLLCRFYDPTSGQIFVNGVPLSELDIAWWRERIALVSQDVHVFNATVAENIAYGKLDATRAEIVAAAERAHALSFIESLPESFDTVLGDRGFRLSGGQRQRLALARALVRDPEILILDEATNALDPISERFVQEALESFGQNRTVIIIAHRLSTIEHADHIVVLEAGRVVEQGPRAQLLAARGLFAKLHSLEFRSLQPAS
ncbi:MAG TPA: ABC transporter ATP-binding protein [Chthoniobacterales bacterium]